MSNSFGTPEKARVQLDALLEAFRTGKVEKAIVKTLITRHPDDPLRPVDTWSLANRLLTWCGGTDDARGYRQWQLAGRHVKKGSKAIYILAPSTRKVRDEDGSGNETDKVIVTGFRAVPVFRYEDTDGDPLPGFDYSPPGPPPLTDVADRLGIQVDYRPGSGMAYGQCNPEGSRIALFTHNEQTFWHELAHAAHARVQGESLKPVQDPEQEAVAELSAAVLARMYGAPNDAYTYDYLSHYGNGDPYRLALKVVSEVESVLTYILQHAGDDAEQIQ